MSVLLYAGSRSMDHCISLLYRSVHWFAEWRTTCCIDDLRVPPRVWLTLLQTEYLLFLCSHCCIEAVLPPTPGSTLCADVLCLQDMGV